jgi:microcystin-dependent protein
MNTRFRKFAAVTALAGLTACPAAFAQDRYIGELMLVGYNFCPRNTAEADGQLLSIAQNTALFSLYGTFYGGDGRTTFALPDLRGRVPLHVGSGPGLSPVQQGERGGQEQVSIAINNMPAHTHSAQVKGTAANGNTDSPTGAVPARLPRSNIYNNGGGSDAAMATEVTIGTSGNGQPIQVRDPFLGMRYCVVLFGIFPSRN